MKFVATQKFVRMSPRKLRLVADMLRDLTPKDAVEILPQVGKRAGSPLSKVIKTAIANANAKGIAESDLVFAEIQINEGPSLKRGRPVSRGRWHPYKRRMSHIRVVLTTKSEMPSTKFETKKVRNRKTKVQAKSDKKNTKSKIREKGGNKISRRKIRFSQGTKVKRARSSEAPAQRDGTAGMKSLPTVSKDKNKKKGGKS